MLSFLSKLGPLIRVGLAQTHVELNRATLGSGLNSGLCAGLAGLLLIGNL